MSIAEQLTAIFDASIPKRVQEALIQCVFSTYKLAHDECERFPKEEAHDLRPFYRWVQLRALVKGLPGRFPEVTVEIAPNGSAGSFHVIISCGQMVLTASTLDDKSVLPRPAKFRNAYSYESQLDLFIPETPPPEDGSFYGILVHAPDKNEPRQPGFVNIIFPDKLYTTTVNRIKLFDRFPDLVETLRIPPEESSDRNTGISRLEKQIRKKE
jgi:hypothetical protein